MLMALAMPVLLGGGGLAVDTAQWFLWKREMQYAADQAAMAGAWSRARGTTGTEYQTRAEQELSTNLQVIKRADLSDDDVSIALADYQGGTDNSVVVQLSTTRSLPFTSMFMSHGATISVKAQAVYEKGRTFTACLIATDPDDPHAIVFGGNAYVIANCGVAALSTDPDSIVKNGNGTFDVGWIVSAGGIDDSLAEGGNEIIEDQQGLSDPFKDLVPPDNPTPQTYACQPEVTTYTATYTDTVTVTAKTYSGTNQNSLKLVSSQVTSSGSTTKTKTVDSKTNVGDTVVDTSSTVTGQVTSSGSGKKTTYTRVDTVTTDVGTVTSIATTTTGGAHVQPGTYNSFEISCDTVMDKGVYVIDGGMLKLNSTNSLVGHGVMFVLKNGAGIQINGGSNLDLRAMTTEEMVAYAGISEEEALKLKDMLIFEDPDSSGNDGDSVNGSAGAILDGTVYLPNSKLTFNGTFGVVSRCMVITSRTLVIEGNTNMTTFCPDGYTNTVSVGGGVTSVRLVA